jgi:hypothetical protein
MSLVGHVKDLDVSIYQEALTVLNRSDADLRVEVLVGGYCCKGD